MRFAKIQFEDRAVAAKAMTGLGQQGRVTVLRDHVFIVPEAALQWLASEQLPFKLLQMLNHDHVVQTLRDHLAHAA
jgi:hypothetical protein